jgi:hypothetical protein
MTSPAAQVQVLLDLAGITPSEEEMTSLVASFPDLRTRVEGLWAADLGESAPALVLGAGAIAGPKER